MAIDLPPALPPQLESADKIAAYSASAAAYTGTINGFNLKVTGDHYLSKDDLDAIFKAAKTPSEAIILINANTARRGRYLVTTLYASPVQNTINVHAVQGTLTGLKGPAGITHFFDDLVGDPDLEAGEFDRARVMANLRSSRSGMNYSVTTERDPADPKKVTLVFNETPAPDANSTDLILQLGNQGSRFVGRYFADAGLTHDFSDGTRVALSYQTAVPELGESGEGEDYDNYGFKIDRPFSFGLYGLDASHSQYSRGIDIVTETEGGSGGGLLLDLLEPLGSILSGLLGGGSLAGPTLTTTHIDLEADINRYGLSGEQVLAGDINYRLSLFERIEHIDSQIEVSDDTDSVLLQDEVYSTVELGVKYLRASALGAKRLDWSLKGAVEGGVTGDNGTLGTNDISPGVAIGKRTAEFILVKPAAEARWRVLPNGSFGVTVTGQYAQDQLPEQQQWVLGGMGALAAYLPGILVGDTGYYGKADFEYVWKLNGFELTSSIFGEHGTSKFEDASGPDAAERAISDVGVRFKAKFGKTFELQAVSAESLSDKNIDQSVIDRTEADFFVVGKAVF